MDGWFDTHAHPGRCSAAVRAAVLARAREAGVAVIGVGVDLASSREVAGIAGLAGYAAGVHPLYADDWDRDGLAGLLAAPGVVAIGECGFDDGGPEWELQVAAFRGQCALAREWGLPLVLHVDGQRAWEMLGAHGEDLAGLRVVRHYFTGGRGQAEWHGERGHFLSFGKPLVRDAVLQGVCRDSPPELILIETDSYPLPGRATEPRDVVAVGRAVAGLRGWTAEETRAQLARNTRSAFPRLVAPAY